MSPSLGATVDSGGAEFTASGTPLISDAYRAKGSDNVSINTETATFFYHFHVLLTKKRLSAFRAKRRPCLEKK
jgi:hypothetical protein